MSGQQACFHEDQFTFTGSSSNGEWLITLRDLRGRRNDETGAQNRSTIRSMPDCAIRLISPPPKHFLTLTLCQDNYAVLSRTPRANSPMILILAEAIFQEGTRAAD